MSIDSVATYTNTRYYFKKHKGCINMTIFVIDRTDKNKQRELFTLFGTPFKGTKFFWLNIPLMIIVGIIIAFVFAPVATPSEKIIAGIIYGVSITLASNLHSIGHIISSRWVNAPIDYILASATVYTTHYNDTDELPSWVHIGRAIGGPIASAVFGLLAIGLYYTGVESHYLLFFGVINLVFFILTISPIPTVDGAVILRELRDWKSDDAPMSAN